MTDNNDSLVYHNALTGRTATRRLARVARDTQAEWLADLNARLINVLFFDEDGRPFEERHVDDVSTLPETVRMTMERLRCTYAVYPYMGRWCLVAPSKAPLKLLRYYDTREAAEMVAIHRG